MIAVSPRPIPREPGVNGPSTRTRTTTSSRSTTGRIFRDSGWIPTTCTSAPTCLTTPTLPIRQGLGPPEGPVAVGINRPSPGPIPRSPGKQLHHAAGLHLRAPRAEYFLFEGASNHLLMARIDNTSGTPVWHAPIAVCRVIYRLDRLPGALQLGNDNTIDTSDTRLLNVVYRAGASGPSTRCKARGPSRRKSPGITSTPAAGRFCPRDGSATPPAGTTTLHRGQRQRRRRRRL